MPRPADNLASCLAPLGRIVCRPDFGPRVSCVITSGALRFRKAYLVRRVIRQVGLVSLVCRHGGRVVVWIAPSSAALLASPAVGASVSACWPFPSRVGRRGRRPGRLVARRRRGVVVCLPRAGGLPVLARGVLFWRRRSRRAWVPRRLVLSSPRLTSAL